MPCRKDFFYTHTARIRSHAAAADARRPADVQSQDSQADGALSHFPPPANETKPLVAGGERAYGGARNSNPCHAA